MLNNRDKISVVIITKDEERNIARCIQSCQKVSNDIVVIDAFSSDQTVTIAQNHRVRVVQKEWIGYGINKNFGNQNAVNDWILSLDADEELDDTLINSINKLSLQSNNTYIVNRITLLGTKWIKYSGWHPNPLIRLFNKNTAAWNTDAVHEKLVFSSQPKKVYLRGLCKHYSFANIEAFKNKMDHYALLRVKMWKQSNTKPSYFRRLMGPSLRFFTVFVLKRGFLDGKYGWLIATEEAKMIRSSIQYYDQSPVN